MEKNPHGCEVRAGASMIMKCPSACTSHLLSLSYPTLSGYFNALAKEVVKIVNGFS
jgi:hypothetical protein